MATVLIIDDDAAMREALAEASRDFGFEARVAASGPDGIAALEHEAVDAVLLDLRMAGMDGLEVLRLIRERPHSPPVTILTAHATATNTIEAMRLGAFDHLTKPNQKHLKFLLFCFCAGQTAACCHSSARWSKLPHRYNSPNYQSRASLSVG
ncbi:MAG TPA: response regulator [Candidatus Acidoferrales bacterium]|nr:response regulator [Candidatus Acidoferrales bacterium]